MRNSSLIVYYLISPFVFGLKLKGTDKSIRNESYWSIFCKNERLNKDDKIWLLLRTRKKKHIDYQKAETYALRQFQLYQAWIQNSLHCYSNISILNTVNEYKLLVTRRGRNQQLYFLIIIMHFNLKTIWLLFLFFTYA